MDKVKVCASGSYDILIGNGLIREAGTYISEVAKPCSVMIVSDDNVFPLYGDIVTESLKKSGYSVYNFVFPHGEDSKNLTVYAELLEKMCEARFTRGDIIVALGGGVVGDMSGFAAATYQRGIRFVQIPTSLLACVDSSVGGKTGVDIKHWKNQVGCFYQPILVLCDIDTLATLPEKEYRCGSAEVIKYSFIGNDGFFEELMETPIKEQYEKVIGTCVRAKAEYVEKDERDTGCRMMLNFGHTIGHAVEACSNFAYLHGEAVAMGMAVITRAAYKKGFCSEDVVKNMDSILKKYDLPTEIPFTATELYDAALADKKNVGAKARIIVPERIGNCIIETISKEELKDWMISGGIKE